MKTTEAYFIQHCDHPTCDLGAFEYTCPKCGKTISDYEIWWKQYDIMDGLKHEFKCEKCGQSLIVEWDKDEYEYGVNAL